MKARIVLPLVVLAAWTGIQTQATAGSMNSFPPLVPPAEGSIVLGSGYLPGGTPTGSEELPVPPPPSFTYSTSGFRTINNTPSTTSSSGTVNVQPSPSMNVSASSTGSGEATANAALIYFFEIRNPFNSNETPVGAIFTASGGVSLPTGNIYPEALLAVGAGTPANLIGPSNFQDSIFSDYACAGPGGCGGFTTGLTPQIYFSVSKDLMLDTNTGYEIYMSVSVASEGNSMATGFIDPTLQIDPTSVDASQDELLFSQGVGNAPLPSTWIMMLSGVFALGLFAYHGGKKGLLLSGSTTTTMSFAPITATPIPGALPLFATGLGAMGLFGWRWKRTSVSAIATDLIKQPI